MANWSLSSATGNTHSGNTHSGDMGIGDSLHRNQLKSSNILEAKLGLDSAFRNELAGGTSETSSLLPSQNNPALNENNLDKLGEKSPTPSEEDLRKAFQDFVGQTLFSQMISSMRSTQVDVPYFNGGRAEKVFQGQLDQILSEELSNASASKISDPMFKLFQLRRQ